MAVKYQTRADGLQLWINLPQEHKLCEPSIRTFLDAQTPHAKSTREVVVKVTTGRSHSLKSRVYIHPPINGSSYIGDLGHETKVNVHHAFLLSEHGTKHLQDLDKG
ncbi:MAG: hypothetical protein JOS17DRAFT_814963 [Linnemannia elongata]|nr:MAG: hypothetical protein JOS17DRAFT_814963 [Linnemannia elongata]